MSAANSSKGTTGRRFAALSVVGSGTLWFGNEAERTTMRLKMEIESAKHSRRQDKTGSSPTANADKAWTVVLDGWQKVRSATTTEDQNRRRNWVGGAVAAYAAAAGKDPAAVVAELERDYPVVVLEPVRPDGLVEFRPGRSTPPPPRSPGAQRAVDNSG